MAQTKSRNSTSSRSSSRSRNGSGSGSGRSRSGSSKSSSSAGRKRPASSPSSRARKQTEKRTADQPKSALATAAGKAKGPAMAGGAALVGLAGGLALSRRNHKGGIRGRIPTPKLKAPNVKRPKLSAIKPDQALHTIGKAAGQVAQQSQRVGSVAAEVQKASEAINKK